MTLSKQLASNEAVKAQWQEALTTVADRALRAYKTSTVSDGQEFVMSHIKRATVMNNADYEAAFDEKPKQRTCRTLKTANAPSVETPGEKEQVICVSYHGA